MLCSIRAVIFAAAIAVTGSSADAKSPFDGHWVEDLQTQAGDAGFDKYLVANGIYKCESCHPARTYPADGKMHHVPGDPAVISESVTIAGPQTIVTRIVDREMTRETTMIIAPDGRTATYVSLDKWPRRLTPLRTVYVAERTAPVPAGAHPVSGSWRGLLCRSPGGISVSRSEGGERAVHPQQFSSWSLYGEDWKQCRSSHGRWQGYLQSDGACAGHAHADRNYLTQRQAARGADVQIVR